MPISKYGQLIKRPTVDSIDSAIQAGTDSLDDHILPIVLLCEVDSTDSVNWVSGYLNQKYPTCSVYTHNSIHNWEAIGEDFTYARTDKPTILVKVRDLADLGIVVDLYESETLTIVKAAIKDEVMEMKAIMKLVNAQAKKLGTLEIDQEVAEDHGEGVKVKMQSFTEFYKLRMADKQGKTGYKKADKVKTPKDHNKVKVKKATVTKKTIK